MIPKLEGIANNNGKTILEKTLMDQERKEMRQDTIRWNQWMDGLVGGIDWYW